MGQKLLGVSAGSHGLGLGIEKHAVVTDGEDTCQFMGHHHYLASKPMKSPAGSRINSHGRLNTSALSDAMIMSRNEKSRFTTINRLGD
jgi:hypothetical protein